MIAKPFSPGNAFPAEEVAAERLTFDKAMIGSCTNGGYEIARGATMIRAAASRVAGGARSIFRKRNVGSSSPRRGPG
jgi:homoaconitase/3-isopropylmalate dehydratase large subunit